MEMEVKIRLPVREVKAMEMKCLMTATAVARIQQKRSAAQRLHASDSQTLLHSPQREKTKKTLRPIDDTEGQSKWIKFVAGPIHPE